MEERKIGNISHFFDKISVGVIALDDDLKVGDNIHIKGPITDFDQEITSMQIDRSVVKEAKAGQSVGLKLIEKARSHDVIYKIIT